MRDCRAERLLRHGDFDIRGTLVPERPLQVLVGLLRGGIEESGLFCGDLFVGDHPVDFLFDHAGSSCDVGDFQNLAGGPGDFLPRKVGASGDGCHDEREGGEHGDDEGEFLFSGLHELFLSLLV